MNNGSQKEKSRSRRELSFQIMCYSVLTVIAIIQIFPFWLKFIDAMHAPGFIPKRGKVYAWFDDSSTFANFGKVITSAKLFQALGISLLHAGGFTFISMIVVVIVGYVLAKKKFRGRKVVSTILMATMMIPGEVLLAANFKLTIVLGINTSTLGIILPGVVNIFGVFLVASYMINIPDSVLEAASIDGCGEIRKLYRVVFPMAKPIIMTYVIITFIGSWNEYLFPLLLHGTSGSESLYTLQIAMESFNPNFPDNSDGYVRSAGMILITVPIIVMYLIFQKYILNQGNLSGIK